jgi:hypothetical protein
MIKDCFGKHNKWTGIYTFNCVGYIMVKNFNSDVDKKMAIFQQMCITLHRALKWKRRKDPQLKFYKFTVVPAVLYGCEAWTPTGKYHS